MIVRVGNISIGDDNPLVLFAGPCVVESREMIFKTAEVVQKTAQKYNTPVLFKSSYKKANRTSGKSFAGIGMDEALKILAEVRKDLGLPILTDIHTEVEVSAAAQVADVLQIPAFLCRQTELLQAAGRTGRVINIKKGQFLAPEDMRHAADKVMETGNSKHIVDRERDNIRLSQPRRRHAFIEDHARPWPSCCVGRYSFGTITGRRQIGSADRWAAGVHFPASPCRCGCRHRWPLCGSASESGFSVERFGKPAST